MKYIQPPWRPETPLRRQRSPRVCNVLGKHTLNRMPAAVFEEIIASKSACTIFTGVRSVQSSSKGPKMYRTGCHSLVQRHWVIAYPFRTRLPP